MMSFDLWHTADPDAESEGGTLEPPADGIYEVALTAASAFTAKESGVPFVKTSFKDVVSEFEWTVLHGFKSQAQANVTKKTCRTLGVDIDNVTSQEQLDQTLGQLVGTYYAVTVKTNGKFRNTYIDGPTAGTVPASSSDFPPQETVPAGGGATDEDDIPFRAIFPDVDAYRATRWNERG